MLHSWFCYYRFSYYVSLGFVFCFSWFFTFFSVLAKRLSGKSIPEITCFILSGTLSIYSVSTQSICVLLEFYIPDITCWILAVKNWNKESSIHFYRSQLNWYVHVCALMLCRNSRMHVCGDSCVHLAQLTMLSSCLSSVSNGEESLELSLCQTVIPTLRQK